MRLYRITCVDRAYSSLSVPLVRGKREHEGRRVALRSPFPSIASPTAFHQYVYIYIYPPLRTPAPWTPFEASSLACVNHAYRFSFVSTSFGSRCPACVRLWRCTSPLLSRGERARGPTAAGTPSENALVPPPPILFATMGRVGTTFFSGLEIEAMIWIKVSGIGNWKRIRFRGGEGIRSSFDLPPKK